MSGKHPIGSRIRFLKTIREAASGDHPAFLLATAGETGSITGHNTRASEGYMVKTDGWPTPFGASPLEFEVITQTVQA